MSLTEATLGGWCRLVALSFGGADGFTCATSGTTGLPKLCRQRMAILHAEASFWSRQFPGRTRIIQLVPAHHIYGFLFTVLLADLTSWPVQDARMMHPGALAAHLRPTDLLVAFPTVLSALLRSVPELPPGLHTVSATASLSREIHGALQSHGATTVIDIYGSSETAGVAYRRQPEFPFELLPHWQRSGEGSVTDLATGESYPLPDRVTWDSNRLLRPAYRVDGAVQVGGVNVFPPAWPSACAHSRWSPTASSSWTNPFPNRGFALPSWHPQAMTPMPSSLPATTGAAENSQPLNDRSVSN